MKNQPEIKTAYFDRFHIDLPAEAVADCDHQGDCDEDVAYWAGKLNLQLNPELLRRELKEYGAWDAKELSDHEANLRRILWIAAGNIHAEEYESAREKI